MSEGKESRRSNVPPGADALSIFCARVGIDEAHCQLARVVFESLVDSVTDLVARAAGHSLPSGLDILLARPLQTLSFGHAYESLDSLDTAIKEETRRCLRPLAGCMHLRDYRALETELLEYPLLPPVGSPHTKAIVTLAFFGACLTPTAEFDAYANNLGMSSLARTLLLGVLRFTLTPWPWIGPWDSHETRMDDPVILARLLRGALPDDMLAEVVAGVQACSRSDGDKTNPLLIVARSQFRLEQDFQSASAESSGCGAGRFCPNPFTYAQANPDATVHLCSPALLSRSAGTLRLDKLVEIWKSDTVAQVQQSILDGSFRYCDASHCRVLRMGLLPKRGALDTEQLIAECVSAAEEGPTILALAFEDTRGQDTGNGFSVQRAMRENAMGDIPGSVRRIILGGESEPLEDDYCLHFLRSFEPSSRPGLRITVRTNGLALTPTLWSAFCREAIDSVEVRVDAATPETYALNGSGGFERLTENLEALGRERVAGRLEQLCLSFAVQLNNYREMPRFVDFARGLGANCIRFLELRDPGGWPAGEFRRRAIARPEHPQHLEFVGMLRQACFADADVDLTDLADLLPQGKNREHGK